MMSGLATLRSTSCLPCGRPNNNPVEHESFVRAVLPGCRTVSTGIDTFLLRYTLVDNYLLGQWLNFKLFGDYIFSRENQVQSFIPGSIG